MEKEYQELVECIIENIIKKEEKKHGRKGRIKKMDRYNSRADFALAFGGIIAILMVCSTLILCILNDDILLRLIGL